MAAQTARGIKSGQEDSKGGFLIKKPTPNPSGGGEFKNKDFQRENDSEAN
jgi:hypothetical protein